MAIKIPKKKINKINLNPKHEVFCQYYAKNSSLFGNATMCYAAVYNYNLDNLSHEAVYEEQEEEGGYIKKIKIEDSPYDRAYNVCSVEGARLLRSPKINERVSQILLSILTPEQVDSEMAWVISQRQNLSAKNSAMREFNKLRGRIIDKFEINDIPIDSKDKNATNKVLADFLHGLTENSK